jgi:two-component system NtrC family response regulator
VVPITLPPLRERLEDLPALAARILGDVAPRLEREPARLTPEALARLAKHPFPGNVRELKNVLERASVLAAGPDIGADDLGLDRRADRAPGPQGAHEAADLPFAEAKRRFVAEFERSFLGAALRRNGGNVSRTAEAVGMVRQSLQQKMRELGLRADQPVPEASDD